MTTPLSSAELQEIRERAEKATPGPWRNYEVTAWGSSYDGDWTKIHSLTGGQITGNLDYDEGGVCSTKEDSDFITHARTDIPRLLATVEALQAELDQTKAILSDPTAVWCNMLRGGIAIPAKVKDALMRAEKDTPS